MLMSPASIFCTEIAALLLVRSVEGSPFQESGIGDKIRSIGRVTNKQHANDQKGFDIVVHGVLLWASVGFLMPVGTLAMRMSSTNTMDRHPPRHKILLYVHAALQVASVLLVTIGAVLSIRKFENAFDTTHQRIGLALYGVIYLQVLIGFNRPARGSKHRRTWYFLHWMLGTSINLVGTLNVYTGLHAFHARTSRNTQLWTIIFTAQASFMTVCYLFQDKWEYVQQQGRMEEEDDGGDGEPNVSPKENGHGGMTDEDPSTSPTRSRSRSNALGTHFSRTNVLNTLLQQPNA
ncbi:cytochrome b561 domain-containing protein At2g30890-like [Andrographis paniculata]|uniref:cytochrome b561 domain-containing protein At2g30890-like n=1 Tax=Andrographis paniculata TaxID=175694 RepID=UPI0021E77191|nr:cytochrome b561 domain-containing protein At2g30890-like [Andrographis paniculata]